MAEHINPLYLDQFSPNLPRRLTQALEVSRLVREESLWITEDFPGTVERYVSRRRALKSLARTATHEGIEAYVLRMRKKGIAYGVGTIILDQTVRHPEEGSIRADDIDYWLGFNAVYDAAMHQRAVQALMRKAMFLGSDAPAIMATASPRRLERQAVGFECLMDRIGDPAVLSTASGEDPWGLTRGGAKLQLFVREKITHY